MRPINAQNVLANFGESFALPWSLNHKDENILVKRVMDLICLLIFEQATLSTKRVYDKDSSERLPPRDSP